MKPLFRILMLSLSVSCAQQGLAQDAVGYPNRPVHIIVPFSPGGPGDILARVVAERLRIAWKQPVIIEPRPGAATQIGTAAVAKAVPDGYTMGIVTMAHVTNPSWFEGQLPYDAIRDLRGVTQLVDLHIAILGTPKLEANNLSELIALSKRKPGQITFGTVPGTGGHLAGEFLNTLTGASLRFVPYKGAQEVKNDLIPGRLDLSFDPLTEADMQLVRAKRLKLIALAGRERSKLAPEYPLASETVPGFIASGMMGLVVPKATPTAIVQSIYSELNKAMESGDLREAIMQLFMEPKISSPEEFDALIASETAKWTGVVRKIKAGSPEASRK